MKSTLPQRIDRLLGEIGHHPHALDPDEAAAGFDPPLAPKSYRLTGACGKSCYTSERNARKAAKAVKSRGANTSFFRPYFCPTCKAWHLTSTKNAGTSPSSSPNRNASHQRRNHSQPPLSDEP